MNTVFQTDTSTGFADSVLYQNTPAVADYLPRVFAYHSRLFSGSQSETAPTTKNLREAKVLLLDEVLGRFSFHNEASLTHAVAMMLQPLVRPLIFGPTPLYVVSGPNASGKTTLVEATISLCGEKNVFSLGGYSKDRKWQRHIAVGLTQSPTHFWIKDYESHLSSPALADALNVTEFTVRKLDTVETMTLPVRCLWVCTSTKPSMSQDIALRSVSVQLTQDPIRRIGQRMEIGSGTPQPRLFNAALTLVRAWLETGQPRAFGNVHSCQDWSQVMGGILELVGIPGFLDE